LRTHYDGVLAFIGSRLTNAISEGLNPGGHPNSPTHGHPKIPHPGLS
jgi:hypothetical protein